MGGLISLPMFITLIILILIKIRIFNISAQSINASNLIISTMIASTLSTVFTIIHEFLHAFVFPKNALVQNYGFHTYWFLDK